MSSIGLVGMILAGVAVYIVSAGIPALIVVLGLKRGWRDAALVGALVPTGCGLIGALLQDPRPLHILTVAICDLPLGFLAGATVAYPIERWRSRI